MTAKAEVEGEKKEYNEKKLGPRVLARITYSDKDFEIKEGEIKNLPTDWEKRKGLKFYIDNGRFEFIDKIPGHEQKDTPQVKEVEFDEGITLDKKDIWNFLNQNTNTVIKQLKINDLNEKDLRNLIIAERNGKGRGKIIKFIKSLLEVNK